MAGFWGWFVARLWGSGRGWDFFEWCVLDFEMGLGWGLGLSVAGIREWGWDWGLGCGWDLGVVRCLDLLLGLGFGVGVWM